MLSSVNPPTGKWFKLPLFEFDVFVATYFWMVLLQIVTKILKRQWQLWCLHMLCINTQEERLIAGDLTVLNHDTPTGSDCFGLRTHDAHVRGVTGRVFSVGRHQYLIMFLNVIPAPLVCKLRNINNVVEDNWFCTTSYSSEYSLMQILEVDTSTLNAPFQDQTVIAYFSEYAYPGNFLVRCENCTRAPKRSCLIFPRTEDIHLV